MFFCCYSFFSNQKEKEPLIYGLATARTYYIKGIGLSKPKNLYSGLNREEIEKIFEEFDCYIQKNKSAMKDLFDSSNSALIDYVANNKNEKFFPVFKISVLDSEKIKQCEEFCDTKAGDRKTNTVYKTALANVIIDKNYLAFKNEKHDLFELEVSFLDSILNSSLNFKKI